MSSKEIGLALGIAVALIAGTGTGTMRALAQIPQNAPAGTVRGDHGHDPSLPGADNEPYATQQRERMAHQQMSERRQRMVTDADRLVRLAGELKEDVDKTGKDEMSLDTIKKAAEVEKLARDIKERMKGQ